MKNVNVKDYLGRTQPREEFQRFQILIEDEFNHIPLSKGFRKKILLFKKFKKNVKFCV